MVDNVIRDVHDLEALDAKKPRAHVDQKSAFVEDLPQIEEAFQQQEGLWQNLPKWRKAVVLVGYVEKGCRPDHVLTLAQFGFWPLPLNVGYIDCGYFAGSDSC
jgi:hypothetical protein